MSRQSLEGATPTPPPVPGDSRERATLTPPPVSLLRLLALVSPALPVGAFAYSQGLEQAVAFGWVKDEASARSWIVGLAGESLARVEVPMLARLHDAWTATDGARVRAGNDRLWAMRGTRELRAEDTDLGRALARVLVSLGIEEARDWMTDAKATYVCLFALAAARWQIPKEAGALGYLFSFAETQVGAAARLVPLGQTSSQRILAAAIGVIPAAVATGLALHDDDIGFSTPGQCIASARHEQLYSRLFRS
jgi:urease accessory protein